RDGRVQLEDGRGRVDKPVAPLPCRQLAPRAVPFRRLLAAAARDLRRALAQFGDELLHPLAPARELLGIAVELRGQDGHSRSLTPGAADNLLDPRPCMCARSRLHQLTR